MNKLIYCENKMKKWKLFWINIKITLNKLLLNKKYHRVKKNLYNYNNLYLIKISINVIKLTLCPIKRKTHLIKKILKKFNN